MPNNFTNFWKVNGMTYAVYLFEKHKLRKHWLNQKRKPTFVM